jgi:single-strand DNA-binding protein
MKGLNRVTLIGHLGSKPDIRVIQGETKVSHVSIATTEMFRDDQGQRKTHTDWHNLVLWGKLSDIAEKYLHKGNLVYIEGKLKTRSYIDGIGVRKYITEVIVEKIVMIR